MRFLYNAFLVFWHNLFSYFSETDLYYKGFRDGLNNYPRDYEKGISDLYDMGYDMGRKNVD